jgi:hypothetical protein
VAQQKLNLFQLAPGAVAEARTRSSQVMGREFYDSNLACVPLDDMPHHGSNVTGFTYQIDDGPVILATLEVVNGEFSQFAPPQATTE